jgi:UDP-GlcNAc:undecaprenyl-phosphate GlcNAc-1-phosphate transferase
MLLFYFNLIFLNILIIKFHNKLNLIGIPYDYPDKVRKFHSENILISGGSIIFLNTMLCLIYLFFTNDNFTETLFNTELTFFSFIFLSLMFFFVGFFDDRKNINPNIKLLLLGFLFLLLVISNEIFLIKSIKLSFLKNEYFLNSLSIPFTILCFLLFTNAINMFDGINLQSFNYNISIVLFFLINNIFFNFFILITLSILIFGYLNYKNKSFLGDGGCYLLSFLFGSTFIASYNLNYIKFADTIFLLMILPGIDMLRLFTIRLINNKNPFKADREHIHHKLLMWLGYKKTSLILALLQFTIVLLIYLELNYIILLSLILFSYFLFLFLSSRKIK